ncbi:DUF4861 family protein [Glaciecola sp. KUL10]|uniref:DUF4861 family protein n=1 Tax=Glaciecola sp. (strain KUL10) TaxID=2161813 RepID=UPI000D7883A2|nr:DUF4861 family protein [Glaciecola sp. KUL10]GBL05961.1 hypothetical protein KUL10_32940 [Glaciecola sp. KUL10]
MKFSQMKILSLFLSLLLINACSKPSESEQTSLDITADHQQANQHLLSILTIKNTSTLAFENVPVTVTREQLINEIATEELQAKAILNPRLSLITDGQRLTSQQDDLNADGKWDELVFLIDLPANDEVLIRVESLPTIKMVPLNNSTNIRFAKFSNPEKTSATELSVLSRSAQGLANDFARQFQMEGPSWENQRIGFRSYFDERNGFDIFGKTHSDLVLDTVGLGQNYHEMQDWGMDILKVGRSLGAGGLAFVDPLANDIEQRYKRLSQAKTSRFTLVKEGPIRSIFDIDYHALSFNGAIFDLKHRISIWSKQDHYVGQVTISESSSLPFSLAVGIVNFHDANLDRIKAEGTSLLSTFGLQAELNTSLGMAVLSRANQHSSFDSIGESVTGIERSELSIFKPKVNETIEYRFYAIWQPRFKNIDSIDAFTSKMKRETEMLRSIEFSF